MPADPVPVPAATVRGAFTIGLLLPLTAACYGLLIRTALPCGIEWAFGGLGGLVLGLLYWHRSRGLGFVPFTLTGAAAIGFWAATHGWSEGTVAVASGLV